MKLRKCAVLICGCAITAGAASGASVPPSILATWHGTAMFEDFSARTQVSPDERWILRTSVDGRETLLSYATLQPAPDVLNGGLENLERLVFCGRHGFLRLGTRDDKRAWFGPGDDRRAGEPSNIPVEATPVCSLDGKGIAHFTSYPPRRELPPPTDVFVGSAGSQKKVNLGNVATGAVYAPSGETLYVIARQPDGASSLFSIDTRHGTPGRIARDLDAWPFAGVNIAIAPDDSKLIVALASLHKPDDAERQKPLAHRWLSIVGVEVKTGQLSVLRPAAEHDKTDPAIAGKNLYWVDIAVHKSVVALPSAGGASHAVVVGIEAYGPSWSRDGKRMAYVFGEYRLADWALSQDIGIVNVDSNARTITAPRIFIQGSHEDFPPDWSPNGKWVVWHSHRAMQGKNPAYYDAPGTTDAIYIRAAEDVQAPERMLSGELWETGWAYWSPDGSRVIYTSWDRNGEPGKYYAAITRVDQDSGRILGSQRLNLPSQIRSPQIVDWSPDGRELAIEDASGASERTLWITSSDGRNARKIIAYKSETYGGVAWMPDARRLVFSALDGAHMQIHSIGRDGRDLKRLSDGQGNLLGPRVSPDGKWIACSRVDTVQKLVKVRW
jgi:Tol biopolymer transport system component